MSLLRHHARDRELPAALQDPDLCLPGDDRLRELVAEHLLLPGYRAPIQAELWHARWKPGTSAAGLYLLGFSDGEQALVGLKLHRGAKAARTLASGADERLSDLCGRFAPRASFADGRGLLWEWHADRELRGLPRLHDLGRTKRWLRDANVFPGATLHRGGLALGLLRYKPERRAVLRLDAEVEFGGARADFRRAIARVLPPEEARRVAAAREALSATGAGPWPALLASDTAAGLLLEERVEHDGHEADEFGHAELAGRCLARLHARRAQPAEGSEAPEAPSSDPDALARVLQRLPGTVAGLRAWPAESAPRRTWIHGDLHPDQVVHTETGGALLDLDACGLGDPLRDLASWIADHMMHAESLGLLEAAAPLLHGYQQAGGTPPAAAELACAVVRALLAGAAGCLRRMECDAPRRAQRLVECAREILPRQACLG